MAVASFGLPGAYAPLAAGAQAAFYLLAAADSWIPPSWPVKRICSLARTFVVLMAASLCAVAIFFRAAAQTVKPGNRWWVMGAGCSVKRISASARTFVVLMYSGIVASFATTPT